MTAPSIGPLISGALGYSAGWRWIFWFLCIVSGSCLTLMSLTLPETARTLVGNGSIEPPITSKLPFQHFSKYWQSNEAPYKWDKTFPNPWKSISLLMQKDTGLVILAGGAPYMTWSCIHASLATLFIDLYHLNQFQAGLIYLPFGVGCTVSTLISAKTIDRDYRKTAEADGLPVDRARGDDLNKFPIEKARLRSMLWPIISCTLSVIGYGWTLHIRTVRWPPTSIAKDAHLTNIFPL
jgi:MFS family permease